MTDNEKCKETPGWIDAQLRSRETSKRKNKKTYQIATKTKLNVLFVEKNLNMINDTINSATIHVLLHLPIWVDVNMENIREMFR